MATPISTASVVDEGGNVLCCKYVKTGFNNPGVLSGTGASILANAPGQTANAGTTLTLTADSHLGVSVLLNTVASTVTLPAATGTGNSYQLFITTSTTSNHIVQAAGSDKIYGIATVGATTAASFKVSNNTTFTMSSTTTGGLIGGALYFTDLATNLWIVEANLVGSGTAATPISA